MTRRHVLRFVAVIAGGLATVTLAGQAPERRATSRPAPAPPPVLRPPAVPLVTALAAEYRTRAEQFATRWAREADAGDHFRLAFDQPDTWSQKYNLVWDRVLGLHLFPVAVAQKEMAFYRRMQGRYGLALDNRRLYTKLDWITWTATLTGSRADFEALVAPVFDFLNATPHRVPMSDWYWTHDATKTGFQARSVVGGVFLRLLYDEGVWKKWDRQR